MPQILDFVAQSYVAHSKPLSDSRCVNMYAEIEPQDIKAKTPVPVFGHAGLSPFAVCGAGATGVGPVQAFNILNDQLYAVAGTNFYQVNADSTVIDLGTTLVQPTGVSIDNNGIEIVWVDGFTGWQYSVGSGVQQITDVNFFPSQSVRFFDGYFCFSRKGTKEYFLSPVFGVTPLDGALFASKEATSDNLVVLENSHEQLLLFGEKRIEVWYDAGNPPPTFPFQRNDGALIQRGLVAAYSVVLEDNTVFWLGDDGVAYRLNGFVPERISTHGTEKAWQSYPTMSDCQAFSYTFEGHKFIQFTFPSGQATWTHDVATKRWHERESWLGGDESTSIGRWRGNCAIQCYDRILIGDSQSGQIAQVNPNYFAEFDGTMRGLLIGPPIHADRRRCFMKRFEIDVESGVGLTPGPNTVTTTYCAKPVVQTWPTALATSGQLTNTPTTFASFFHSMWVYLPDDGDLRGVILTNQDDETLGSTNPGLFIEIANNVTANPQIVVRAWDAANAAIVAAAYDVSTWGAWTNVIISLDTASQQIAVWTSTVVAGVLVEQALTPVSLVWSSTNPISNAGGHPWRVLTVGP